MARDRGYGFVIAAFVVALAVAGVLAFVPLGATATEVAVPDQDVAEDDAAQAQVQVEPERSSLVEEQGWGDVLRIIVPLLLVAGAPLVVPSGGRARIVRGASTVLLFGGAVVGMLSIGILVLPVAVLMLVATVLSLLDRAHPQATMRSASYPRGGSRPG